MTRGLLILVELLNFWVVQTIEVSRETWPLKVVVPCLIYVLILWDAPPPNNRGHQEANRFWWGVPINLHLPLLRFGWSIPKYVESSAGRGRLFYVLGPTVCHVEIEGPNGSHFSMPKQIRQTC